MIVKDGPFGSVTITDAPDEYRYVRVECPDCASLRSKFDRLKLVGVLVETRARVGPLVTDTHLADALIKYLND